MMPQTVKSSLNEHDERVRELYALNRSDDLPRVYLPNAIERKAC